MRRKPMIMIFAILLIGINIVLLGTDHENKVERKSYIKKWTNVVEKDMFEFLNTEGVMTATEEESLYFDKQLGSFQEFLVDEGDFVSEGDELYVYHVHQYSETESYLEQEIDRIEEEVDAIESVISTIDNYNIPQTPSIKIMREEEDIVEIPRSSVNTEWMKEQYKIEKEKELSLKEAQLESVEDQLRTLEETGHSVTVTSPYEGRITMLSKSLDDPILFIETTDLHIEGELAELERPKVIDGLAVDIYSNTVDRTLEGEVAKVSEVPKEKAINGDSRYAFNVMLSEDSNMEELLPGYHVDLRIKTKESLEASVVPERAVIDGELWKMTEQGEIDLQHVATGIHMGKWYEVTEGAVLNEFIALEPFDQFRQGATFVTPLKLTKLPIKETLKMSKESRNKYLFIGMISR